MIVERIVVVHNMHFIVIMHIVIIGHTVIVDIIVVVFEHHVIVVGANYVIILSS